MTDDQLIEHNSLLMQALKDCYERYGVRFMRMCVFTYDPPQRHISERMVLTIVTQPAAEMHAVFDSTKLCETKYPSDFPDEILKALAPFTSGEINNGLSRLGGENGFTATHSTIGGTSQVRVWITGGENPVDEAELEVIKKSLPVH